jgi:hypothetical protein
MSDMTKLPQHIDEMGVLLTQTAQHEQSLVKALSEALSKVDEQLVKDIRKVAVQHQARRAEIFMELQALAHCIGAFPAAHEIPHEIPHGCASTVRGRGRRLAPGGPEYQLPG